MVLKSTTFLQEIKCAQLKAPVTVVWDQLEKYSIDFDAKVSYLGQMVARHSKYIENID